MALVLPEIRKCKQCGLFFMVNYKKQKYCSLSCVGVAKLKPTVTNEDIDSFLDAVR